MTTKLALRTRNLSKTFGTTPALQGLDLVVPEGSVYAFLGPNGAGKTTTIKILVGLIAPDAGDVELFGSPLHRSREASLARIGALVETPSLYSHLTGRENLRVTAWLNGATNRQIDRALEIVALRADADRVVSTYSQGMRQRLGLALALVGDPDLLILDEPTNGLDPAGMRETRQLIRMLALSRGGTVFLSSHLLGEVEQIATHVGIVSRGRLLFQGTLESLQAQRVSFLHLEVSDPPRSEAILQRHGRTFERRGSEIRLYAPTLTKADVASINATLVNAGIDVYHVGLERPTLEQMFIDLTQPSAGASPASS